MGFLILIAKKNNCLTEKRETKVTQNTKFLQLTCRKKLNVIRKVNLSCYYQCIFVLTMLTLFTWIARYLKITLYRGAMM